MTPLWNQQESPDSDFPHTLRIQINGVTPAQLSLAQRCCALLIKEFPTLSLASLTSYQRQARIPPVPGFDLISFADAVRTERQNLQLLSNQSTP